LKLSRLSAEWIDYSKLFYVSYSDLNTASIQLANTVTVTKRYFV